MKKLLALCILSVVFVSITGCEPNNSLQPDPNIQATLKSNTKYFVEVNLRFKYDKGEIQSEVYTPMDLEEKWPCPWDNDTSLSNYIEDEKPMVTFGIATSDDTVVIFDPILQKRFIKSITVKSDGQTIEGDICKYFTDRCSVAIKLRKKLKNYQPPTFNPTAPSPLFLLTTTFPKNLAYDKATEIKASAIKADVRESYYSNKPQAVITFNPFGLVSNTKGQPLTIAMPRNNPSVENFKLTPDKFPALSSKQLDEKIENLQKKFSKSIFRVALSFRNPSKDAGKDENERYSWFYSSSSGGPDKIERTVQGIALGKNKVLVLFKMSKNITAYLKNVRVYPDGKEMKANFDCTLKHYGTFIVTTEKPLPESVRIASDKPADWPAKLVLIVESRIQEEKISNLVYSSRIQKITENWKETLVPEIKICSYDSSSSGSYWGGDYKEANEFAFDLEGNLIAFQMEKRKKIDDENDSYRYGSYSNFWFAKSFCESWSKELAKADIDELNKPTSDKELNALGWTGVVLQPLNSRLAQVNNVTNQTLNGQFGAIVSYVYPNSPAAKADIQPGDILLQFTTPEHPKPIFIQGESVGGGMGGMGYWECNYGAEYMNEMPVPWPSIKNRLTKQLTELGFGKKYMLKYIKDGKVLDHEFIVQKSPDHFGSADKYKSERLGVTVKDITFEVRRHFKMQPNDSGVIICRIEPGSKCDVARMIPYERIIYIDDKPVNNVKEFEKYLKDKTGKVNLCVKKLNKTRIVSIDLKDKKKSKDKDDDSKGVK